MKQQEQIMVDWTELERDLKQCQSMIGSMCAEGRPPKMSIPARPDYDEDIFICETINKTLAILSERREMLAKLEAAQKEIEMLKAVNEGAGRIENLLRQRLQDVRMFLLAEADKHTPRDPVLNEAYQMTQRHLEWCPAEVLARRQHET